MIKHGGVAAEPFIEGPNRAFHSTLGNTSWMRCLRERGIKTVTVSPFGERHSAWHWYANFSEIHNTGKGGLERADEISPVAIKWIKDHGKEDNWFLHVNFWDPHTPYRTPDAFGEPFADTPLPTWLNEDVRRSHWASVGPHSAREIPGYDDKPNPNYPKQPFAADSMTQVRRMFDGYDNGVKYVDEHFGRILQALMYQGVFDDTAIIISADHGENLGELNIYGDHQTADQCTSRVPLIIKWPGITTPITPPRTLEEARAETRRGGRVDSALHYHVDFAATMIELAGGQVPKIWDGQSFAAAFRNQKGKGRDYLVVSQGAWSCQRSVRFEDYLAIRSYHDGHHAFPDWMLFDVKADPHEQHDLAQAKPDAIARATKMLDTWQAEMMSTATTPTDPMQTVLNEGGPFHTRGHLAEVRPKTSAKLAARTGRRSSARNTRRKRSKRARKASR